MAFWSDEGCELMERNSDIDMAPILKFVKQLCLHLDSRFPENELEDCNIIKFSALRNATFFDFGKSQIRSLIIKYQHCLEVSEEACRSITTQYCNFWFLRKLNVD